MSIEQDFEKIHLLKNNLGTSLNAKKFMASHKEDLVSLLGEHVLKINNPTKKDLKDLLDASLQEISFAGQYPKRKAAMETQDILPLKSFLLRKQQEELAKSNYLVPNLVLSLSPAACYFRKNFDKKISQKQEIDAMVMDCRRIPEGFQEKFNFNYIDQNCQEVKELFKKAQPLVYHKQIQTKTWRVVFIDGKIVVFRTLKKLLHKEKNLTKAEEKRIKYGKLFNAHDTIYDARRAQDHIIDDEEDKIDEYGDVKNQMIRLVQDIALETKQLDEKRKLNDIIKDITKAESFQVMAASFYNLYKINFMNKSITTNLLKGASNKISKELDSLHHIILEISLQSEALEGMICDQEYALQTFHAQMSKSFVACDSRSIPLELQNYYKQLGKIPQKAEPFLTFERQVQSIFGVNVKENHMLSPKSFLKAEILIASQKIQFQVHKLEHKIKIGTAKREDFIFDMSIVTKYSDLQEDLFGNITSYVDKIQEFGKTYTSKTSSDSCITCLQELKKLSDWESNVQVLKNF